MTTERDTATLRLIAVGITYLGYTIKYGKLPSAADYPTIIAQSNHMVDSTIQNGVWPLPDDPQPPPEP